ncbi:MAG: TRAP transporter small permease [Rhodoferax sp.]|nr:TRAP transporter small permease [Rhodoferax sp.]MBP9931021.1 TRAP transporter small permease [Rhodoferax sp.]HQZ06959.1 TRAP transporter small permease [Burkholderiaceae bacterium]HRA62085.1 TRAP transporter small permease [Burkholderiaceae bacterium]
MTEKFHRLMDAVYLACIWISGISILLMSLIIPWGIFARYVLGSGSSWPEPVAVLLMVTFTFFGAAATYRAGGHIAVGMLTDRLPEPLRWACEKLVDVAMVGICLFVMVWGEKLSMEMMRQGLAELPWLPVGYTYLPLPIGSLLTLLFVLENALLGSQAHRAVVTYDHDDAVTATGAN